MTVEAVPTLIIARHTRMLKSWNIYVKERSNQVRIEATTQAIS